MRTILHVDMDAFYASVEECDQPSLKGKPLIVGGTSGRGVVAAANYAVRAFGVRSAMPIREALRRCPQVICIPPRMARYKEVSRQIFKLFNDVTPIVEGLSLDEAFLDVTAVARLMGNGETIAINIRQRILKTTGLTASVGIAPNKLLAKIASDLNKPDGLCCIEPGNVQQILDQLPIQRLFGVGQKTLPLLQAVGIHTFRDLAKAADDILWRVFGKHGGIMRDRARGIDDRPVEPQREEKSISAEETFAKDLVDPAQLATQMAQLADRTAARLRAQSLFASTINVKIRRADFTTFTRQRQVKPATQETQVVCKVAQQLFDAWQRENSGTKVRLLGVGVSDLSTETTQQSDLFCVEHCRNSRLDAAIDGIRGRFGSTLVTRASLLPRIPD